MSIYRQETYVNDEGAVIMARIELREVDCEIPVGRQTFHVQGILNVTVDGQPGQVHFPVDLPNSMTIHDAYYAFPEAFKAAAAKAEQEFRANVAAQQRKIITPDQLNGLRGLNMPPLP